MATGRNQFIDLLRGFSMAAVISLHALAHYLGSPLVFRLWDWQQFAVQLFVFCSAYLYFSRPAGISGPRAFIAYVRKRFIRLYMPYAWFAVIFFAFVLLLRPDTFSPSVILASFLLTGGIDINWLVLLFVQFLFLFPLMQFLRDRGLFPVYAFIATAASVALFFVKLPVDWKYIMWIPWSAMAAYAVWFLDREREGVRGQRAIRRSYILGASVFILLLGTQYVLKEIDWKIHTNKYPPNALFLSYGIMWIGILDVLYRAGVSKYHAGTRFLSYLSIHSYSLYFIHYIAIYLMDTAGLHHLLPWYAYLPTLFLASILGQWAMDTAGERLDRSKKKSLAKGR